MDHRNSRKHIAEQTLRELEQGYYVNPKGQNISIVDAVQQSIAGSRFYSPAELENLLSTQKPQPPSVVTVTRDSTIQSLTRIYSKEKKVALLNFASARNPGGGFLGGSQAQEESLARSSSLYPTLLQNEEYYKINRRAGDTFYTDSLIYSPQVVFFKSDDGDYLDPYLTADVITMPAVNRGALKSVNGQIQKEIDHVMKKRIRYVLAVSEKNNIDVLVLGAWGCGVFRNEPEKIADNFREVLAEKLFAIPEVVFAVLDREKKTYRAFLGLASI